MGYPAVTPEHHIRPRLERVIRFVCVGPVLIVLACVMVLWDINPWFALSVNETDSLPGRLYLTHIGEPVRRGDLVAFRWHGGASYPPGLTFIKVVMGAGGDVVSNRDGVIYVNETVIGRPKSHTTAGLPLEPAHAGVIAQDTYFVATPSPNSLDSRYAVTGNIPQRDIMGRVYEIF